MRKTYTLIVMLAMMFVGANSVSAQITVDELIYTISSGKAYVNGVVDATQTDITIPASITYDNGGTETTVPVVGIYPSAFKDNAVLENVHVLTNSNYFTFQASCFAGCTTLKKVTFESSTQNRYYYNYAFKDCINLTQVGSTANRVQLANNLTNNSEGVFMGCTSIQGITYRYAATKIGKNWFKGCTSLKTLNITNAGTIGESAFEGCSAITSVSFLTTQTRALSFDSYAFKNCTGLTSVILCQQYRKITTLPEGIFEGCTKLASITDGKDYDSDAGTYSGTTLSGITSIGANAFKGCSALTRFGINTNAATFRNDLAEIGASAFEGCSSLGIFYLYKMDAAPTLGEDAFTGIKSGATFYLNPNNSYTAVGKYALDGNWKVFFDGTKASYNLRAYVNKTKQYGTVSCDVPLTFAYATTPKLYKVVAADDSYSYLKAVSSRKLPANTGAVIEVGTQTSGDNAGQLYTSLNVRVLFDGSASEADFEDNQLVANVTENTSFVGNEGNTWNLIMNDGKFVKANNGPLAAGLAYLPVTFEGGEAKELSLTTDEPTGIKTIDNGEPTVDNGAWYTIDGTRLQGEPTMKGIYIKNGKKIVVK